MRRLLAKGFTTSKTKVVSGVKYLTSDTAAWQRYPERYSLVPAEELDQLREQGLLVYELEERDSQGKSWTAALSQSILQTNGQKGSVLFIDGPPSLLDTLSRFALKHLVCSSMTSIIVGCPTSD